MTGNRTNRDVVGDIRQGDASVANARFARVASIVAIVAATVAAYCNSFDGAFVYDDLTSIESNAHIRRLWPPGDAMSLPLIGTGYTVSGRPVLSVSFAMDYALHGRGRPPDPWGFHLTNLLIHLCGALVLFGIVRRTLLLPEFRADIGNHAVWIAGATALLWAVHPLQTSAVTYLVQRAASLAGLFFLLTVYCAIRGFHSDRRLFWHSTAILTCALGMGTKESIVAAPLIVLLYDRALVSGSFRLALRRRMLYGGLAATWVIAAGLVFWKQITLSDPDFTARSPLRYALTQPGVILHYLRLSFWPHPLMLDYDWSPVDNVGDAMLPGIAILALLVLTGWGLWRRAWWGLVGAWFFLLLAPTSSFAALRQRAQEQRMYAALAAVTVLFVVAVWWLLKRLNSRSRGRWPAATIASVLLVGIVAALAFRTHVRNKDYQSPLAIWESNLRWRPQSPTALTNCGKVFLDVGRTTEAIALLGRAVARAPTDFNSHYNLGGARIQAGDALLTKGLSLPADDPARKATLDRAGSLFEQAVGSLKEARQIDGDNAMAHYNLGLAYWKLDRKQEAIASLQDASARGIQDPGAYRLLGSLTAGLGRLDAAERAYRKAMAIGPQSPAIRRDLSNVLFLQGRALFLQQKTDQAIARWHEALGFDDRNANVYNALAVASNAHGDRPGAIAYLRKALQADPNHVDARRNLQKLLGADRGD